VASAGLLPVSSRVMAAMNNALLESEDGSAQFGSGMEAWACAEVGDLCELRGGGGVDEGGVGAEVAPPFGFGTLSDMI
jgi:hypothetical protein